MANFFDKLEDSVRAHLSRYPVIYSIFGGIGVVLFWRAVWETAELLAGSNIYLAIFFYPPIQLLISIAGLLLTGLMVSTFIGDRIILSGLRHEKKLEEKTEELIEEEVITMKHLRNEIHDLKKDIEELKRK
jgi:hypothetical protein